VVRLSDRVVPALLAISGWALLGVTAVGWLHAMRPFALFAFTLTVPGAALVRLLGLREPLERAVVAVALSLSLTAVVAELADIGRLLAPGPVLVVLAALCSVAAVVDLVRGGRRPC
jgi:hypothetical protein